ncbi:hypothetical protein OS122_19850 [Mycolicibacterium mucogenicum]|uniref:hypothetical protein n=1 Tax=Mycolicibacterium TaxID=1866885 RepID=UPI00226A5BFE|nr:MULTISPECIES: hypothetical protein [Mycolicibacterium]MCX8563153.1 hypothetical protein [Mycolicibacterium mucogenicum]
MLSGWTVGSLLLVAAVFVLAAGMVARARFGRMADDNPHRRRARAVRWSTFGKVFYGPINRDAQGNNTFDDEELDHMFFLPAVVVAGGLVLAGLFVLFLELVKHGV